METYAVRRQVPETDPIYQQERERSRNMHSERRVFGEESLQYYDFCLARCKTFTESNADAEKRLAEMGDGEDRVLLMDRIRKNEETMAYLKKGKAKYLRENFLTLLEELQKLVSDDDKERREFVRREIAGMFDGLEGELQDELQSHLGADSSSFTVRNFYDKVVEGSISDELLCTVARRHVEKIRNQERRFEKFVEATKNEFKLKVVEAFESGLLPESAVNNLHRVDVLVVSLSDRLMAMQSKVFGTSGWSGEISISTEGLQNHLIPFVRHALFHEFMHEISGISVIIETYSEKLSDQVGIFTIEGLQQKHTVSHRKSGMSLFDVCSRYKRNTWFNEAITDWLACELSGLDANKEASADEDWQTYPIERRELARLFEAGLEKKTVTDAYFENISSEQPVGIKGEYFSKLIRRIDEIEGKFGFARLENKHIMLEIEDILKDADLNMAEHFFYENSLTNRSAVHLVTVSIGVQKESVVTKQFVHLVKPSGTETTTEWRNRLNRLVNRIKRKYEERIVFSIDEA